MEEAVLFTSIRASLWRLSVRLYFGHRPRITPTIALRWAGYEIYNPVRWCEVSFGVVGASVGGGTLEEYLLRVSLDK